MGDEEATYTIKYIDDRADDDEATVRSTDLRHPPATLSCRNWIAATETHPSSSFRHCCCCRSCCHDYYYRCCCDYHRCRCHRYR